MINTVNHMKRNAGTIKQMIKPYTRIIWIGLVIAMVGINSVYASADQEPPERGLPASEPEYDVPKDWLPITYLQSGFFTGHEWGVAYRDYEAKVARARVFSRSFTAIEVLNQNLDTPEGFRDIRDTVRALRTVSEERDPPFLGFWSFPRFPGFFRAEDIAGQPESWRAVSLKADGAEWRRYPSHPDDIESLIKYTGEKLDITHPEAVEQLMANVRRAFQWDGPDDASTGPLFGFVVLNEAMLTGNYESIWSEDERRHDVDSPDAVMRLDGRTHVELFTDDDPYYSFYGPPKRAIPLYSENAAESFRRFAGEQGHAFERLPADRNEFLDDDDAVSLPDWVAFVPLDDDAYWGVWEAWVFDTWTRFVENLHREIGLAQAGNPDYYGAIYFQLPGWYSLHEAADEPITYSYYDEDGAVRTQTVIPRDQPEFDRLNAVTSGTDMAKLMASPWFAGAVHETTRSIPINPRPGSTPESHDAYVMQHDRFRRYFMMQGALLRRVCREHGKLFGAFARSQYFADGAPLSPEAFEQNYRRTIGLLEPDLIATIGPWFFNADELPDDVRPFMGDIAQSGLHDPWRKVRPAPRE